MSDKSRKKSPKRRRAGPSDARLHGLIEEATVNAYDESEQTVGFYTMLEENLATPFTTKLLGVEVTVERLEMTESWCCPTVGQLPQSRIRQESSQIQVSPAESY